MDKAHSARGKACRIQSMACVCLLDGTEVMTAVEYSLWQEEMRQSEDEDCLFNSLRRRLATRFPTAYWYLFSALFPFFALRSLIDIQLAPKRCHPCFSRPMQVRIAIAEFQAARSG